ncbi:hypothetical protein EJ08DRAFT_326310 [Tothia fuscella]|uniref:BTB domain-containing protein n=1 Tax=Tothia fuscella TaxID=1048955 RepID=A0A9P4NNG6_9PEZI|nr:hypothetical protein EJ08DRAFT_326310 [Tothia fuscella]
MSLPRPRRVARPVYTGSCDSSEGNEPAPKRLKSTEVKKEPEIKMESAMGDQDATSSASNDQPGNPTTERADPVAQTPTRDDILSNYDVQICERGDLILKHDSTRYLVSAQVLRLASPILRKIINDDSPEVILFHQPTSAFVTVLYLAHFKFDKVPKVLTFQELVETAYIGHHFQVLPLLRPFVPNWIMPYSRVLLKVGFEEWLYTSWVFGMKREFIELAEKL